MDKVIKLMLENPEMIESMIVESVEKYKPLIKCVVNEGIKLYREYVNMEELYGLRAASRFKMYQAYLEAGFTEEQAMSMLLTSIRSEATMFQSAAKGASNGAQSTMSK